MRTITIAEAARTLRYTEQDIAQTIDKYDLKCQRDSNDVPEFVDQDALTRVLKASDAEAAQPDAAAHLAAISDAVTEMAKQKPRTWLIIVGTGFAALAALAAAASAGISLYEAKEAKTVLYAQNRYQAMSDVADALAKLNVATVKSDEERETLALNVDLRVLIVNDLRLDKGISDENWTVFLERYCRPLAKADYYGLEKAFVATKAMCDKEIDKWKVNPAPTQKPTDTGR